MKPLHIVILGGGTAGWMAANLFAHRWASKNVAITLVESADIGIVGVGEGSTPTLKRFFEILNIDESEWMPQCKATYKTNIHFSGWSPESGIDHYSHPFISQTDTFTERAFHLNARTRRLGLNTHTAPGDFLLNGVLADQGKAPIAAENFPFRMEYGYHFDSHLLGSFLAEHAKTLGVRHVQTSVTQVLKHPDGSIQALLSDSGSIEGDFFVDCSGFVALLIDKTLGVPFNSFKSNLFNDAAVVAPTEMDGEIPVETVATALSNGWAWKIPLTHRYGNGYVYSSDFISMDQAESELRQHLNLSDSVACRHLKMRVGQVQQHWHKNCLALGLAQGFIEPLEATALHLVQICCEMFIDDFEKGEFSSKYQERFNQQVTQRFDRVRDYIVAHYKLNTRTDSEYWRANRDSMNLSDSLLNLLNVWYQRQDLQAEMNRQQINDHFSATSWHCLLAGYGAFPPLAAEQPGTGDLFFEQKIQDFNRRCGLNFPTHKEQLKRIGAL